MTINSERTNTGGLPAARSLAHGWRAAAILIASLAASAASAQDACQIQRVSLCDGCTVPRRITVQKNTGCRFQNSIGTVIFDVKTRVAPRHGVFGKSNETLQAYVPKKGYAGADYFEYVVVYEEYGKRASTIIQNHVTVLDGGGF